MWGRAAPQAELLRGAAPALARRGRHPAAGSGQHGAAGHDRKRSSDATSLSRYGTRYVRYGVLRYSEARYGTILYGNGNVYVY